MREIIDAAALREMLLCANAALEENKQKINELNVFPVPDGDTGTNMSLTMNSAAIELGRKQTETVGAVADCCSAGSPSPSRAARPQTPRNLPPPSPPVWTPPTRPS